MRALLGSVCFLKEANHIPVRVQYADLRDHSLVD
jgi:hypothetical protein